MFQPEKGETLMSLQARIWELQRLRATYAGSPGTSRIIKYIDRRILEITEFRDHSQWPENRSARDFIKQQS